ncbi:MAG: hypothetical protein FWC95_03870 [Defluviitaleaceae bacterium]|nr:hypothetical protein [Defluviitaleaceae bacterium]
MKKVYKVAYLIEIILIASLYWVFFNLVIFQWLAGGNNFAAYIINLGVIAMILVMDELASHHTAREDFFTKRRSKFRGFIAKILFYSHIVSFKSALYLFYILMLVLSRVTNLDQNILSREDISFIYSVEYGILLLIPLDKLIDLIVKDDKRMLRSILFRKRNESKNNKWGC